MQKPNDWNDTQRQTQFGFRRPEPGGYVCRIVRVEDTLSKKTNRPMLRIALDIADGEFKDYYKNKFENRLKFSSDAKWPCVSGVMKQNEDGSTNGAFKNFIECVQESTRGWQPAWNENFEKKFVGAFVGAVFKEEEFEANDGTIKTSIKPDFGHFKNIADIQSGNYEVPALKKLDGTQVKNNVNQQATGIDDDLPPGFETIDEDDIPF